MLMQNCIRATGNGDVCAHSSNKISIPVEEDSDGNDDGDDGDDEVDGEDDE